ncbi:HU family DNA-binding protein [Flavobacterium aciduliphilum]|nr:HU family DNA-binding protein [Flavobacterium aciduliphilum]
MKYKLILKKNPQDASAPEKYYATAIADGEVDFESLSEQIAYKTTLTESDCYAVLLSLERNILKQLQQGKIVRVGRLGSFNITLKSKGRLTEAEFSVNDIEKGRVRFRPGKKLNKMTQELNYRRIM